MKKITAILLILVLVIIAGCSEKPLAVLTKDPIEIDMASEIDPRSVFSNIQDGVEITYEVNEEESTCSFVLTKGTKREVFENVKVTLIYPEEEIVVPESPFKATALEDMEIYDDHSADSNLAGYIRKGDSFEVYETYQDEENIWCRIRRRHITAEQI